MSSKDDPSDQSLPFDFDPEQDLLRRYEKMVQTQISTLNGIDDKAAYVARLVGILAGLILSATSLAVSTEEITVSIKTSAVFILLGLSVAALFVSLVYAIITYLSSKFEYGPSAEMGEYMSNYKVKEQQYKDVLLRGYSDAIKQNRRVVVTNARRFQRCLAAFLAGLLFLFGASIILILIFPLMAEILVALLFVGGAGWLVRYILREEYLTLERRDTDNE
ncbi:hypothetical protein [Haloarcula sediminis]|uniref:hypothetical protein n=1 Tax=Haloarcula sediminis TaxID=3111777 RepID=UPI002D76AED4|nr:hypothetical protein [Haloarcula sp. CK38]